MVQEGFAHRVLQSVKAHPDFTGLAVAGSWINSEIDEYSDLDLILFTGEKVQGREQMISYAEGFGKLLSGFTGEHVGEPKLLICLYDEPLIHVDLKFLTPVEFQTRVEDPVILYDATGEISNIMKSTKASWPSPDLQWIEDRFWTWIHYVAGKIGRGEIYEAFSSLEFLRSNVLSPLLQVKNKLSPRGLRKLEQRLPAGDLEILRTTVAEFDRLSILEALRNIISLYQNLRDKIFPSSVKRNTLAEQKSIEYLDKIAGCL